LPDRIDPIPEGLYLRAVIMPLYRFICDQDYESVDGKFVRQDRDHDHAIGYDDSDVNQLFWYSKGIVRIVLTDKVRLPLCGPIGVDFFVRVVWSTFRRHSVSCVFDRID
jgi:hypothetical protein